MSAKIGNLDLNMTPDTKSIRDSIAREGSQKYITNDLLKALITSQPKKWISWAILIIAFLTLIISIYGILYK